MAGTLYSQHWHRVADLRLRLRRHASLHRHEYRGKPWYVLHDTLTGQVHRFTPEAYQVIGRLDGQRTLGEIWQQVSASLGDAMPTQQEMIGLIGRLHNANVLAGHRDIDIGELSRRQRKLQRSKWQQVIRSPLGIRIPLLDPERFVAATYPLVKPLIGPFGAFLWLATVGLALVVATLHWQALTENLADRVLGIDNLLLMALVYPLIKALHELGHAWTTKDAGGEVHEIGIMLLVFFPVPYVDASAAAACPEKGKRMLVGAAGILVELFLAALAMLVWAMAEPGALRSLMFNVMLIAGVSTLLFNGNPLLRFDAYYVLADWLEIPNLGSRANRQLGYAIKRYLLGRRDVTGEAGSRREAMWLVLYSVMSFAYRLVIMVAIAVFVATRYLFVGVLLALWSVFMTLVFPALKLLKAITMDSRLEGSRRRAWSWLLGTLAVLALLLFALPLPYATVVQGVVDSAEPTHVRLGASGRLNDILVEDGDWVERGDVLMHLDAPELASEVSRLEAQRREADLRLQASVREAQSVAMERENLELVEERLADARLRAAATLVTSPRDGRLLMPQGRPELGQFLQRGESVAVVVRDEDLRVRAFLPVHRRAAVNERAREVTLRLPGADAEVASSLQWLSPRATREVPSETLTREGGGPIALDPQAREPLIAFRQHYLADFDARGLIRQELPLRLDERVYVRIEHPPEPIGHRWWRELRRHFLRLFDR
ncbi:HlyD family efflux transporter periplasmic adaptor subunit [Billgrantia gudaonensis]|uniref:Putative peptide zinc metalloprotease protein n=1 Tax=Billgrantia gudaonensis TaxID=376427 RepID=A0A1G8T489_9GAMM|nr:HlyD family efflux transporter periplasmic adaptor subunit [Halomonas gudaonensis]SDJ36429.1 putative peptide zinc metalloprotease protein [Halomonas gudaonensis]